MAKKRNLSRLLIPKKDKEVMVKRIVRPPKTVTVVLRATTHPIRNLSTPALNKFYPKRKGRIY